jgi:hypothetical protein
LEEGPLYGPEGPKLTDVNQGACGDCFFLSALGALCARRPDLIRRLITDNGDGTYTVHLYDVPVRGPLKNPLERVDVLVDARFASVDGKPLYANRRPGGPLWAMLIEKAYAKLRGGYPAIAGGGKGYFATTTLTGWSRWSPFETRKLAIPEINETMRGALDRGASVTASRPNKGRGCHVFAVLDTRVDDAGLHWLQIRDPYGKGPDGGLSWIRTREFQRQFSVYEACGA